MRTFVHRGPGEKAGTSAIKLKAIKRPSVAQKSFGGLNWNRRFFYTLEDDIMKCGYAISVPVGPGVLIRRKAGLNGGVGGVIVPLTPMLQNSKYRMEVGIA